MEQKVRVVKLLENQQALVMHVRESACSGDCHKCSGCGAAKESILFEADNAIGARVGDLVKVESETGPVLKAAAVMYLIPMVLFFLGYAVGDSLWELGGLTGCLAFVLSIFLAVVYDRKVVKNQNNGYTITGILAGTCVESIEKGDNDVD
jgi:sigma-E factor negative regulatory protein RseC